MRMGDNEIRVEIVVLRVLAEAHGERMNISGPKPFKMRTDPIYAERK